MRPSVRSEVGRLAEVLVHRPGIELERVTPTNKDELLFDELLWVEHAQAEHDAFADVLRDAGVEVLHLEHLLAEVLADPELAQGVVEHHVTDTTCGPQAVDRVRRLLLDEEPAGIVTHLLGGVTLEEAGGGDGLVAATGAPGDLLLHPLPNAVFTRDSSAWIGEGVVLSPMNRLVRRRETDLLRLVYRHHPRFADAPVWFGGEAREHYPATLEGGDVLVVGERGLAVGLSERTSAPGIEALAARLFAQDVVDRILVVELPKVRSAMHLDTVVTQVDVDLFLTYPAMTAHVATHALTPRRDGRLEIADGGGLPQGLAWAADLDHVRTIEPGLGSLRAQREQWNDANNTLALAPGEVVAYERNVATNEVLDRAGVVVRTIPSYELPRGRGGPRCMTCPVRREP
jgi:arginine deiminase